MAHLLSTVCIQIFESCEFMAMAKREKDELDTYSCSRQDIVYSNVCLLKQQLLLTIVITIYT